MRILIYGINYAPELTGIGKYTGEMTQWLSDRGHDVRVVTAPPYYPDWRVLEGYPSRRYRMECLNGASTYRCPLWVPKQATGIKRLFHLGSFALSSAPALAMLMSWKPQMVFNVAPAFFTAPAALFAARFFGAKTWLHIQDFEIDAAFDLGLLRSGWMRRAVLAVERWMMRRFDRVSTISGRMMERLKAKGVTDSQRVFFPNWVDTRLIHPMGRPSPLRGELGIGPHELVALYSGNMGQKQGLEIVIEAARILAPEKDVRFVMCGQGAAYEGLRTMADSLRNILWIPLQPMERLNELLNLADIHLLPQRSDAADLVMPSKLAGIMASGRPVVATVAEGTEIWLVVEGRGINTPPGDVRAFADAIRGLVHDPERRADLGQRGRCYAEEYLSRDTILGRFEAELLWVAGV